MDQLTHNVRRNSWLNIITECQQRPADVTTKQWLAENGIKKKAYYYWLRKLRQEAGEQMNLPATTAPAELAFTEIPIPVSTPAKSVENSNTVAVIPTGSITLEVCKCQAVFYIVRQGVFYTVWYALLYRTRQYILNYEDATQSALGGRTRL